MKQPINTSVKALAHTPQYKMHKYFARRPYNVFENLIKHYSNENQTVLDIFCGGGVTVFEGVKLKRNLIGVDLNPLATFITKMQIFNGNIDELREYVFKFIEKYVKPLEKFYMIEINDNSYICNWVEWTYEVICPECGEKILLTEDNKIKNGIYGCVNANCKNKNGIARTKCLPHTTKPIRVKYKSVIDQCEYVKILTQEEITKILSLEDECLSKLFGLTYPQFEFPMNWDRQKEDKLFEKGIINYSDLYSNRNLFLLSKIFNGVLEEKKNNNPYVDYIYFIFSSTLRYTNKMSKVTENWEGGNPICMDKHAYYLPNSFIENNVVSSFIERANVVLKGCQYSKQVIPDNAFLNQFEFFSDNYVNYQIINCSSDCLPLPDRCIDVIITDPPYGSNVQYAELSVVWNAWYQLYENKDKYIYKDKEAISNRKSNYDGAKSELDYEKMLTLIFKEAYRVLKNDSYMVFTFNNKNLNVWLAMLRAVAKSGFYLAHNGVLFQDFITSYKNTAHLKYEGNVQGDFIYTFVKTDKIIFKDFSDKIIKDVIYESIDEAIKKCFKNLEIVSSEELYKEVFKNLASDLMEFIMYKNNVGDNIDDLIFEEKSIDSHLTKKLIYSDNGWKRR